MTSGPAQMGQSPEIPELRQVARQYEALFVSQMIGAMRKTVVNGGLVPESPAEKTYRGMLDAEHAEAIAESDQIGLSEIIYQQLLRQASGPAAGSDGG